MGQTGQLVAKFLSMAADSWRAYQDARSNGDMEKMRLAFDDLVKFLGAVYNAGYRQKVMSFINENKMPTRAILKKISH